MEKSDEALDFGLSDVDIKYYGEIKPVDKHVCHTS